MEKMKALTVDGTGAAVFRSDYPVPEISEGEALVAVIQAGVCRTDLEILNGYAHGFSGVLGHEFVGVVRKTCPINCDLIGFRVCGEINQPCGICNICTDPTDSARCKTLKRNHCKQRKCIGIHGMDGAMATLIKVAVNKLIIVPDILSDTLAVMVEPFAAALRPFEQGCFSPGTQAIAVVGDGKLGLFIMELVMLRHRLNSAERGGALLPCLFGHHPERFNKESLGADFINPNEEARRTEEMVQRAPFDVVVEASGNISGAIFAARICRPMGTLVLKSTLAPRATEEFAALSTQIVIKELQIVGSRCGPMADAMDLLANGKVPQYVSPEAKRLTDNSTTDPTGAVYRLQCNMAGYIPAVYLLKEINVALDQARHRTDSSTVCVHIRCDNDV